MAVEYTYNKVIRLKDISKKMDDCQLSFTNDIYLLQRGDESLQLWINNPQGSLENDGDKEISLFNDKGYGSAIARDISLRFQSLMITDNELEEYFYESEKIFMKLAKRLGKELGIFIGKEGEIASSKKELKKLEQETLDRHSKEEHDRLMKENPEHFNLPF